MRAQQQPFTPVPAATINFTVTASSASKQLQTINDASGCVRIYNAATAIVFVEFGGSSVVATAAASMPVAPGLTVIVGNAQQYVAVIGTASSGIIYFTPGDGVS